MSAQLQRKLTTILAADAAGYSRAMEADEVATFDALRAARSVFTKLIDRHQGRLVNTAGDGLIAEFASVVEAVQCAVEVQNELHANSGEQGLRFRIGIHLGDVLIDGSDLLGEGVNLAARLQSMAEPGGILISQQVYDQVQHKLGVGFEYLGERRPKNFAEDVSVYKLELSGKPQRKARKAKKRRNEADQGPSSSETSLAADEKSDVIKRAKVLGVVWLGLVFVDLMTDGGPWAQWPGLAMLGAVLWQAAPLLAKGWFNTQFARLVVISLFLVGINLLTWTGTFWAIWPVGAVFLIALLKRIGR